MRFPQTISDSVPAALLLALIFVVSTYLYHSIIPGTCFSIVRAKGLSPIRYDKCTGRTWMLKRTQIIERTQEQRGLYTFRWHPITAVNLGELQLEN